MNIVCLVLAILLTTSTTSAFVSIPSSRPRVNRLSVFNTLKKSPISPIAKEDVAEMPIRLPEYKGDYYWDLGDLAFSLLPLAPGRRRRTLVQEVVKDTIWTLDQIQGVINVNVPVRAVIVKLAAGGLLVYNPVGPTKECLKFVRSLESKHGKVKHIVLGTLGLEHKALAGPFSQSFPEADVWLQPGQWSFPINLPSIFLGFPVGNRLKQIPANSVDAPWAADFDHRTLGPLRFKSVGGFGETAFFHKSTGTLLVTDSVIRVGDNPPPILEEDPRALLYHSRDSVFDEVKDTPEARRRGFRRMTLFGLTFFPSGIAVSPVGEALTALTKVSNEAKILGRDNVPFDGLYPWRWVESEEKNFKALQGGLLVAPILRKLILDREPERVIEWADAVSRWPIKRIIPSHFENNIAASGSDFRRAFTFLEAGKPQGPQPDERDMKLLSQLSEVFTKLGVVGPSGAPVETKKAKSSSISSIPSIAWPKF